LCDLTEQQLDEFISELNPPPEGQAFANPIEMFRRRRRLLSPPLTAAVLRDGTFAPPWAAQKEAQAEEPEGPVDVVLTRVYAAEMPQRSFEAKIVIGADHEFAQKRKVAASHARVVEGVTGNYLPVFNIPFLQGLQTSRGASLYIRIVFLDGKTSRAAVDFLKSDLFKAGIRLTRTFNPVFGTTAQYLSSLTASLLSSGKNRVVSQGTFGLFDYGGPGSGSFGVGDYLFAQLPADIAERAGKGALRWDKDNDRVMDGDRPLDANHVLLRIAKSAHGE
jgi:hypothetical protein